MTTRPDKYAREIEEILAADNPSDKVRDRWAAASPLFQLANMTGKSTGMRYMTGKSNGMRCGCLTLIRNSPSLYGAEWPGVAEEIAADERIPTSVGGIQPTREGLEVFAEWQRRLDEYRDHDGARRQ